MMECLTIEAKTHYNCFTGNDQDTLELTKQLQEDTHQQNAEWLHLMIDNNRRQPQQEPLLISLLETVAALPHLKEITISGGPHNRRFPVAALTVLLRKAVQLESLQLHDIGLGQQSPYEMAELLKAHPTLHKVSLMRCTCRPVHVLIQALSRMPHLKQVQLDGTMMSQQHEGEAIHALMAVCQSVSLERLELGDLGEVGMIPQLVAMMNAIGEDSNLKELSLQLAVYETLPVVVVSAMARMLTQNHTLQRLTVPWMGGGEIWLPLIGALTSNRGLQELRLHGGSSTGLLSNHFLQKTATVLKDNTHLTHLWYDTWVDKDLEIDLYLLANKFGRGHLMSFDNDKQNDNATHEEWVQALVASKDHVHVTNYWLAHNPSLLIAML
ncbi:expressed unknown protein [Seminavis robusta]|uniref:Uncharacterized protein n=1 Tax=Seminavis robusta TaxID=568900 RepID=A0A9N8HFX3_9STRA|nr:expressed unknown protein [Seminavis robusta]|eukprot:Sro480_g151320.1 n/a (382) ;mRNA; r:17333-18478